MAQGAIPQRVDPAWVFACPGLKDRADHIGARIAKTLHDDRDKYDALAGELDRGSRTRMQTQECGAHGF